MLTKSGKVRSHFLRELIANPFRSQTHKQQVTQLYRHILKELKVYKSIKRASLYQECRRSFRTNSSLNDTEDIDDAIQIGKNALTVLVDQNDATARTDIHQYGLNYKYKGSF